MKNILHSLMTVFGFLLSFCLSLAQERSPAFKYDLEVDSIPFQPLEVALTLTPTEPWDSLDILLPLRIKTPIHIGLNNEQGRVTILSGFITNFGERIMMLAPWLSQSSGEISPYSYNLLEYPFIDRGWGTDTSRSTLNYQLIGEPDSQIAVFEWLNVGLRAEYLQYASLTASIDLQIWLYETPDWKPGSVAVEYRYGPVSISPDLNIFGTESGPTALMDGVDFDAPWRLDGPADSPVICSFDCSLRGVPKNGQVYRFIFLGVVGNTPHLPQNSFQLYPNPAQDHLYLAGSKSLKSIRIRDIHGRLLKEVKPSPIANKHLISISEFPSGIYLIEAISALERWSQKWVKVK